VIASRVRRPRRAWADDAVSNASIVEDNTMDRRRFRRSLQAQRLEQARLLGWLLIMMFVVVKIGTG
jgi:hypothetical protein